MAFAARLRKDLVDSWNSVGWPDANAAPYPARPILTRDTLPAFYKLVERTKQLAPDYTPPPLDTYVIVDDGKDPSPPDLADKLRADPKVLAFHEEELAGRPPTNWCTPAKNPVPYMDYAPLELGADCVTAKPVAARRGAKGERVRYVLLDNDMWPLLGDPYKQPVEVLWGQNCYGCGHGSSMLNILSHRQFGMVPNASACIVMAYPCCSMRFFMSDYCGSLIHAGIRLQPGDVLLVEAQSQSLYPLDYFPYGRETVHWLTRIGIVVVEAAGNGWHNLTGMQRSGAILVGAAKTDDQITTYTNYGDGLVTSYAWSDETGTSITSAIVAGAVIKTQAMSIAKSQRRLSPAEMQYLFTRYSAARCPGIGSRPDLRRIWGAL